MTRTIWPFQVRPATASAVAGLLFSLVSSPALAQEAAPAEDGGAWSENARLVEKSLLLDVEAVGERYIAVGDRGHILVSPDAGKTWSQSAVPTRSMLNAVVMVDESKAWAVGHDAVILHSEDGGLTWTRQHWAPDWEQPLFDVWFENAEHGLAVGAYGLLLETTDGGLNWNKRDLDEDEPHLYLFAESQAGKLYLVGEFGSIYRSDDHGGEWTKFESPYGGSFFGVLTLKDESVLAFGLRGSLFHSTDQGASWTRRESGITTGLFNGAELTDDKILLVGQSGTLVVSADGGQTFTSGNSGNRDAISAVKEQSDGSFMFVGEKGIYHLAALPEAIAGEGGQAK